jgi:hypothetical protein
MSEEARTPRALELSDLTLESAAFEVRYDMALLHWDRAGALWNDVRKKYPSLNISKGSPGQTAFSIGEKYELTVELLRAYVVAQPPQVDLDEFLEIAESLVSILVNHLEITDFTRVGFRHTHVKEFGSRREASEAVLSFLIKWNSEGPVFGIKEELAPVPEVNLRWEGKALGATLHMYPQSRHLEFDPPPVFADLDKQVSDTHVLVLDIDQFTSAPVSVGQLRPGEWARSVMQAARRDCGKFMRG